MRVVLVALPNPVLAHPTAHFPQGLLYVGGALKRAGHEVVIADMRDQKAVCANAIPEGDLVGVSSTSGEFASACQVARAAAQRGARTMIGGAHATFMPGQCTQLFDYVVMGHGELAAVNAIDNAIRGMHTRPLDSLAGYFPDWDLIGERGFSRELFPGEGYGSGPLAAGIASSRGCGFYCSYCRSERDKVLLRPIADVVAEVEMLKSQYGISHFRFYDENFTNPKARCLELCEALAPLRIHIRAHTRSDAWDDERAAAFKRAGGEEMGFGFESASDHVLRIIRKQETVDHHREAVRVCRRWDITAKAFWMTALPGETWDDIAAIKQFMLDERPEKWIVSSFAPYSGSDIWAHPQDYGVTWMEQDLALYWNFSETSLIEYEGLSRQELTDHYHHLKSWLEVHCGRS